MYVCLCKGITEDMIEQALIKSPKSTDALRSLGVGSDCGVCMIEAVEKVQQKMQMRPQSSNSSSNRK